MKRGWTILLAGALILAIALPVAAVKPDCNPDSPGYTEDHAACITDDSKGKVAKKCDLEDGAKVDGVRKAIAKQQMVADKNEDLDVIGIAEDELERLKGTLTHVIHSAASVAFDDPYEKSFRVRYRIDGVLQKQPVPPEINRFQPAIISRLKIMARLNIAEKRLPQDGRIKLKLSKTKALDFRVSTCPTLFGEKIVLRILDPSSAKLGIDALGYEDHQKGLYQKHLGKPYGMILVTGPTGSGKTVSLYTGLNILNTEDRNISTASSSSSPRATARPAPSTGSSTRCSP